MYKAASARTGGDNRGRAHGDVGRRVANITQAEYIAEELIRGNNEKVDHHTRELRRIAKAKSRITLKRIPCLEVNS